MTCIIGLVYNGHAYVGADSASVECESLTIKQTSIPKVFKRGPFVIGYTTSFRMGQLLEHWLEVPEQEEGQSNQEYMVKEFVEAARNLFKEKGFSTIDGNSEIGGTFLVGYKDHLYEVCADFQVAEMADGFNSVGCGSSFALGALMAYSNYYDPTEKIVKSLKIAEHFSAGVCSPFNVLSTKRENDEK